MSDFPVGGRVFDVAFRLNAYNPKSAWCCRRLRQVYGSGGGYRFQVCLGHRLFELTYHREAVI